MDVAEVIDLTLDSDLDLDSADENLTFVELSGDDSCFEAESDSESSFRGLAYYEE